MPSVLINLLGLLINKCFYSAMNFDSISLILSCIGVIQTLFLATYIFSFQKIEQTERILLASLLIAITIRLIKSIGWYFFDVEDPLFLNAGFVAHGFIGPLLLLYFSKKTQTLKKPLVKFAILLPAILLLISSPFLSLNRFWYIGGYQGLLYFTIIYQLASAYLLWVIYIQKRIYFPWYRNLFIGVFIFCISYFTNYVFGLNPYILGPVIYAFVIYAISFVIFKNHEIFTPIGDTRKYKNINLSEEQIALHRNKVQQVMTSQKPYLQSDFSLSILSQLTAIPKHLLSRFFSENMNQSFTDFTNSYRIEKAKELLTSPSHQNHKIAFIAYECGFNSLSSFNTAFRKNMSQSPSEYKKLIRKSGI